MAQRIAIITGASRGLGRNMALHLADRGVATIGTYRTNKSEAETLIGEIEAKGAQAAMLPLDVGQSASFSDFAQSVRETLSGRFGTDKFDYLVNNAGMGLHSPITETTSSQIDELLAVHVKAPLLLSQALLPLMGDGGRILNVSSGLARFAIPGYGVYAAAKGAVEVLTRYMAKELGGRQIRVNVIAPGAIETDFGGGAVRDNADLNRMIAQSTALGRVGRPDDIGGAVAAILSEEFGWANGERIEVSGGQNL